MLNAEKDPAVRPSHRTFDITYRRFVRVPENREGGFDSYRETIYYNSNFADDWTSNDLVDRIIIMH